MPNITRRIVFHSGHRVMGHEGHCRNLHGHTYIAQITVESDGLDSLGRVVDFSVIKSLIGGWVDSNFDHNIILNKDDPQLLHLQRTEEKAPYVMPEGNPTAENIAKEIFLQTGTLLPSHLKVVKVRLYETENCWADYPG